MATSMKKVEKPVADKDERETAGKIQIPTGG